MKLACTLSEKCTYLYYMKLVNIMSHRMSQICIINSERLIIFIVSHVLWLTSKSLTRFDFNQVKPVRTRVPNWYINLYFLSLFQHPYRRSFSSNLFSSNLFSSNLFSSNLFCNLFCSFSESPFYCQDNVLMSI